MCSEEEIRTYNSERLQSSVHGASVRVHSCICGVGDPVKIDGMMNVKNVLSDFTPAYKTIWELHSDVVYGCTLSSLLFDFLFSVTFCLTSGKGGALGLTTTT